MNISHIFNLNDKLEFEKIALQIFQHQAINNKVYWSFLNYLEIDHTTVREICQIPFLPIQFFKTHKVLSSANKIQETFLSSGTTGLQQSKHYLTDLDIYKKSFSKGFEHFYGNIENYTVLALLPGYLERNGSSLIYMVDELINKSKSEDSGFYLNNLANLSYKILNLESVHKKTILIGVSYALLDLLEFQKFKLTNTIIMETGGMKGKRKEMIREELHQILCKGFDVDKIHSEYGMTELLSQAYSKGKGIFTTPPWMKVLARDTEDPLSLLDHNKAGGLNIIDLANINSCSFIATQDLGKTYPDGSFEILGRFDNSDIRGCNLMVV